MPEYLLIGVGGAGGSIATVFSSRFGGQALVVNTDAAASLSVGLSRHFLLGPHTCAGTAPTSAKQVERAVNESASTLAALCDGQRHVVLLAGLGGFTGSIAIVRIAQMCLANNAKVSAVVTTPFEFEHSRREFALSQLAALERLPVRVLVHDHMAQFPKAAAKGVLGLEDYFAETAESLTDTFYETHGLS